MTQIIEIIATAIVARFYIGSVVADETSDTPRDSRFVRIAPNLPSKVSTSLRAILSIIKSPNEGS